MIYPANPLGPEGREAAQKALAAGLAVAIPTDTVYVLAVDPFVPGASDRLFELVGRSRDEDLPVLVASVGQALKLATAVPEVSQRLMERFWSCPGTRRWRPTSATTTSPSACACRTTPSPCCSAGTSGRWPWRPSAPRATPTSRRPRRWRRSSATT